MTHISLNKKLFPNRNVTIWPGCFGDEFWRQFMQNLESTIPVILKFVDGIDGIRIIKKEHVTFYEQLIA